MIRGVDAHTHLDHPAFDADRSEVLARARAVGVTACVVAGADPADWDRLVGVAEAHGLPWVLGVHPWWVPEHGDAAQQAFETLQGRTTPHGVGETGLDFGRAVTPAHRDRQLELFRDHLALARERDVPVVLHVVRAYPQALQVLASDGLPAAGGMIHSWSGHPDFVRRAVRLGLALSFSAGFTRSERIAAAMVATPASSLCFETDCPDQAVDGGRGEPADWVRIVEAAASLRAADPAELAASSSAVVARLFPACDPRAQRGGTVPAIADR